MRACMDAWANNIQRVRPSKTNYEYRKKLSQMRDVTATVPDGALGSTSGGLTRAVTCGSY